MVLLVRRTEENRREEKIREDKRREEKRREEKKRCFLLLFSEQHQLKNSEVLFAEGPLCSSVQKREHREEVLFFLFFFSKNPKNRSVVLLASHGAFQKNPKRRTALLFAASSSCSVVLKHTVFF